MLDADANSAKTLVLIAIILQAVFLVIGVFTVTGLTLYSFSSVAITKTIYNNTTIISTNPGGQNLHNLYFPTLILILISLVIVIGLLWILLDYFLIYRKLSQEKVSEASTPSLVLGILQLLFGGLIPGILIIIAYVKIRDSINKTAYSQQIPK